MSTARARAALAIAALAAGTSLAACGGGDDKKGGGASSKPKALNITVSGAGPAAKLEAPKSVAAGPVELRLSNEGKGPASAQLIRFDEGHEAKEALGAAALWGERGKPLPEWVHLTGGVGTTKPGATGTSTVALEPGKYMVVNIENDGGPPAFAPLEATGKGGGTVEAGEGTVTASEYKFTAEGLKAGKNLITLDNAGEQPHHLIAAPIAKGKTFADVKAFIKEEQKAGRGGGEAKGPPPISEKASEGTSILDGGEKQLVELNLKAGKYALICFIPDRTGGPPHAFKGMVSEATVR